MDRKGERGVGSGQGGWLGRALVVALAVGLFGCDHATKIAAKATIGDGQAVPVAPNVLGNLVELRYTENPDVAFSLLRTFSLPRSPAVLVTAATLAIASVALFWLLARRKARAHQPRSALLANLGFAAILGGALGNVTDRIARGAVVDFIHVKHWPIFNVADVAVVVGMGLVALGLRSPRSPASPGPGSDPRAAPRDP